MVRVAVSPPVMDGLNVTLITHELFAATLAPLVQVVPLAIAKSPASVPLITGAAVIFTAALPLFVTVTACAELAMPTASRLNVRLVGEILRLETAACAYATVAQP